MLPTASLAIGELVSQSGFDRRTIVYYIQQGLLPKVGRRGPNTRYPAECLLRLKFIRKIKELQDHGRIPTVTLADIGRVIAALPPERLQELAVTDDPNARIAEIAALFAAPPADSSLSDLPSPEQAQTASIPSAPLPPAPTGGDIPAHRRSYGLADASIRQRFPRPEAPANETGMVSPTRPVSEPARVQPDAPATQARESSASPPDADLGALLRELELRPTLNQRRLPPGAPEQWTEVPITSRIYLSIRGLSAEDASLADDVGRILKRALRGR